MSVTALTDAARTYLAADSRLRSTLGSDEVWDTWIFQERPYAVMEGTQQCCVVLSQETGWAAPNGYNTSEFPRLGVQVWADPQRDSAQRVAFDDTSDKITRVLLEVNRLLHAKRGMLWGDLMVVDSVRLNEPAFSPVEDGDRLRTAVVYFALTLGGWV